MESYLRKIGRVSAPVLLHLAISFLIVYVGTVICMWQRLEGPDAALMTVLSAAASLPFLWKMWKRDRRMIPNAVEWRKQPFWFYLLAFGGGAAASCLGSWLMQISGAAAQFSNAVQEELFAGNIWVQLIGMGVITPAAEELIFRGLFYQRLREWIPREYGILLTALIFALWHQNPIQILYAFPMGLLLQIFYEKCGSLKAPVLFHMGANFISILVESLL